MCIDVAVLVVVDHRDGPGEVRRALGTGRDIAALTDRITASVPAGHLELSLSVPDPIRSSFSMVVVNSGDPRFMEFRLGSGGFVANL